MPRILNVLFSRAASASFPFKISFLGGCRGPSEAFVTGSAVGPFRRHFECHVEVTSRLGVGWGLVGVGWGLLKASKEPLLKEL